jgi:hypothetical protein
VTKFVGIPQACESCAIQLGVTQIYVRAYAQAFVRPDLDAVPLQGVTRLQIRNAIETLATLLAMIPEAK